MTIRVGINLRFSGQPFGRNCFFSLFVLVFIGSYPNKTIFFYHLETLNDDFDYLVISMHFFAILSSSVHEENRLLSLLFCIVRDGGLVFLGLFLPLCH